MSSFLYNKKTAITGKNALITGGTKNLGGETARELARFGANLFLHYHSASDAERVEKFAEELRTTFGVKVGVYQGSLNDESEITKLFEAALEYFEGGIDIAIENVGKIMKKAVTEVTETEWEDLNTANNKSAFFFIKKAGQHLNAEGKLILLTTSLLAAYTPAFSVYQGGKAAVEWYAKAASNEWKARGISVNCVAPGPMDTPFFHEHQDARSVAYLKGQAMYNRLTEVSDIVPIIRFLVTEGYWITGQTIFASGGFAAR